MLKVDIENITLRQLLDASKTEEGRRALRRELLELEDRAKQIRAAFEKGGYDPDGKRIAKR